MQSEICFIYRVNPVLHPDILTQVYNKKKHIHRCVCPIYIPLCDNLLSIVYVYPVCILSTIVYVYPVCILSIVHACHVYVLTVLHGPIYLHIVHSACLLCTYVLAVMHDARVVVRDFIVVLYLGGVPLEVILRPSDDVLSQYTDVATPVRPRLLMVEPYSMPQLVHDHTFLVNEISASH